jgi:hypothetical protein
MTEPTQDDELIGLDGTSGDEATRAAAPGIRQDPDVDPFDREPTLEVDTGSPQDAGEPNEDVVRE